MKQIVVFASGTGTNFDAIFKSCQSHEIEAKIALLVCDNPQAKVINKAIIEGIPTLIFNPKDYENKAAYETEILDKLETIQVDLICLAGYMRLIGPTLLLPYQGRIINIHPALLPAFKGAHAIKDAFDFGVKVYGVTIHAIDQTIDGGQILAQRAFEYHGHDLLEVEAKIHSIEHMLYPETIQKILNSQETILKL